MLLCQVTLVQLQGLQNRQQGLAVENKGGMRGFNRSHQRFRSGRQRESELGDRMSRNRTHPITNYDSGEQRWHEEFNRSHRRFRSGRQRESELGDSMSRNRTHPITDYDSGEQRWHEEFNSERQRESELDDRMSRNRDTPYNGLWQWRTEVVMSRSEGQRQKREMGDSLLEWVHSNERDRYSKEEPKTLTTPQFWTIVPNLNLSQARGKAQNISTIGTEEVIQKNKPSGRRRKRGRRKDYSCPMVKCDVVTPRLKWHFFNEHSPGVFHEDHSPDEDTSREDSLLCRR